MIKTVAKLTVLKLAGSLIGLAYVISQAKIFGANSQMDAYFIAMTGVYIITSLVQGGQLAEVFLPEYSKAKYGRPSGESSVLFSLVLTRILAFACTLSVISFYFAPFFISSLGPGLAENDASMASDMFRWAVIMVVLTLFSSFVNTTLNAEGVFGRAESTGLASQSISIVMLWTLHEQIGIWILIYSQTVGKFIELISGSWFLYQKGVRFRVIWKAEGHDLNKFFRILWATSGYVISTQLFIGTVTACLSVLPPGTLTLFNYIKLFCIKVMTFLLGPLSTVVFSKLAKLAASGGAGITQSLSIPVRVTILLMTTIAASSWLAGHNILGLILGDILSSSDNSSLAHKILYWGLIGAVLSGVGSLFRKTAVSLGKAEKLYTLWSFAQILSAVISYVLIVSIGKDGIIWILPINMGLLAVVSIKISSDAGVGLGDVIRASPWSYNWQILGVIVSILPFLLQLIPFEITFGDNAALVRLPIYLVSLAGLSISAFLHNRSY